MEEPMEEGAPDNAQVDTQQEEKKSKVTSILRPGSMGTFSYFHSSI